MSIQKLVDQLYLSKPPRFFIRKYLKSKTRAGRTLYATAYYLTGKNPIYLFFMGAEAMACNMYRVKRQTMDVSY